MTEPTATPLPTTASSLPQSPSPVPPLPALLISFPSMPPTAAATTASTRYRSPPLLRLRHLPSPSTSSRVQNLRPHTPSPRTPARWSRLPALSLPFSPTDSSSNRVTSTPTMILSRLKASTSSPAQPHLRPPSLATTSRSPEQSPPSRRSSPLAAVATLRPRKLLRPPSHYSARAILFPPPSPSPPPCSRHPAASTNSPRMRACESPSPP